MGIFHWASPEIRIRPGWNSEKGSYYTTPSLGKVAVCISCGESKGSKWIFGLFKPFSGWYTQVPTATGIWVTEMFISEEAAKGLVDHEPHKPLPLSPCSIVEKHHTHHSHTCSEKNWICLCIQRPRKRLWKSTSNRQNMHRHIKCLGPKKHKSDDFSGLWSVCKKIGQPSRVWSLDNQSPHLKKPSSKVWDENTGYYMSRTALCATSCSLWP